MVYIYIAFVFFLAGVAPELTGFGVSTVMMVLLPLVLPLEVVIPIVAIVTLVATGIVAYQTKSKFIESRVLALLGGSLLGVPLGMLFLDQINEQILSAALGVFLIAYSIYGLIKRKGVLPANKFVGSIVGVFAGFFGASFNINGPLVGIYSSTDKDLNKNQIKDLTATYLFFTGILTISGHAIFGRITKDVFTTSFYYLPFMFLGLYIGAKLFGKISGELVRIMVYTMTLIGGFVLLF